MNKKSKWHSTSYAKNRVVKRNVKSSVFTHLFNIPKYKKELYLSLHPKDNDIKSEDIRTWTLSSIFTNIQVNDLGLLVRDTLLVLVEAQSTWTLNILPRMLEYLAESYNRYVIETNQNIYGTKKIVLPKAELYVLYTGSKKIKESKISLKKEFFDNVSLVEIEVNVISLSNSNRIVKEYIRFSKILDKNNKLYKFTKKSISETIRYCIKNNILKEYLEENKKEVYNIMTSVYDQDTAIEMCMREKYAEGKAEGRAEGEAKGRAEGSLEAIVNMFKKGIIKIKDAAKELGVSEKEFMKLAKA